MKKIALSLLTIFASVAWACPEGTHSETKTKTDWVCAPSTQYVCEWVYSTDPETGESKSDYVCEYKTQDDCSFQTSTYEECVADPEPYYPEPDPEPYYPPTPTHVPASLDTLKVGDQVVTMNYAYLQVGSQILATVEPRTTLAVNSIHPDGWFWTTYRGLKGWVQIRNVYIKR